MFFAGVTARYGDTLHPPSLAASGSALWPQRIGQGGVGRRSLARGAVSSSARESANRRDDVAAAAPRSRVSHPRLCMRFWLLPGRRVAGRGAGGGNAGRVSVLGDRPSCVWKVTPTRQQGGGAQRSKERISLPHPPTTHTHKHTPRRDCRSHGPCTLSPRSDASEGCALSAEDDGPSSWW